MLTRDNGLSCRLISAEKGHLDVMKALLEAGGRELVMLTTPDGASCFSIARRANLVRSQGCWKWRHLVKAVNVLGGPRNLLAMTNSTQSAFADTDKT
jgi:hypothetical protein